MAECRCLLEGCDLSVVAGVEVMRAFAEDRFAVGEDAADGRIRRGEADGGPRQI
jgi:hypothetical protein